MGEEQKEEKELLFIQPIFKEAIWGGERLRDQFGYSIPSSHTGECWAISAHKNGDCVIDSGTWKGKSLSALWNEEPHLFGKASHYSQYPLLVKIIDAKADLSIQVHPDNKYAMEHENGSLGKTECWYILDCDQNAAIVIGHHAKDQEDMRRMIQEKRWKEFIREIPVKKGDFFQINPGCLHAIKGGTLVLETQQSSDITYRVYDYDRLSDGKPRPLHIKESMEVIQAPYEESKEEKPKVVRETESGRKMHLVACDYYSVDKIDLKGSWKEEFGDSFANVSILEGKGTVNGIPVRKGQHFIVPADFGSVTFEGELSVICSQAV